MPLQKFMDYVLSLLIEELIAAVLTARDDLEVVRQLR